MKDRIKKLLARFDALSRRERIAVSVGAWLLVLLVMDTLAITPAQRQSKAAENAIGSKQTEVKGIEQEIAVLRGRKAQDPEAAVKQRIGELEQRIALIDGQLKSAKTQIVPPEKMAGLLEQLLRRNKRLELVSLRSVTPEAVVKNEAAAAAEKGAASQEAAPADGLYRQGMELTLNGSYGDMLDYVAQIEQLPWKIFWGRMEMKVEDYPRARLVLNVYTLSLDKTWISI
jgi:MSHA biogenesis protein MshJ